MRKVFSSRFFVVVILLIIACIGAAIYTGTSTQNQTIVTKAISTVIAPVQKGVSKVVNKISEAYNYIFDYNAVINENQKLKTQVREMEQTIRDANIAIEENDRLRSLMGIKQRNRDFEFEVAEVTGQSVGNWATKITIDKGTLADISVDDCVITEDGIVGYISSVGPNYAEITTVIDTEMSAGALITRTREVVVAEGDYTLMENGYLKLSYLKKDSDIVIGDTVETSGRGGIFPKGIMIGTVERIIPEDHGITNYAVVKPFVDVNKAKSVFVIKDFKITD